MVRCKQPRTFLILRKVMLDASRGITVKTQATRISRAPVVRDRLRDLAGTLPTHCDGTTGACRSPLCSLAADAARAWFALSGALPPDRPPGARSCLVDEGRLTEEHWKAIRAAFAFKCRAKYPGAFGGPKGRKGGGGKGRPPG